MCLKSGCERKIFVPKMEEITREWRKFHTAGFHYFNTSSDVMKVIRLNRMWWAGQVLCLGKREKRRPRHRWEDNI
jgi:hypothetical protein